LCGHLEFVHVAILFQIHFTQMVGRLCRGAPLVVYVEHWQYIECKCRVIVVGNFLDAVVTQYVWCVCLSVPCCCIVDVIHAKFRDMFYFAASHVEFLFCFILV